MSVILATILALGLAPAVRQPHPPAPARAGCDGIYDEFIRQDSPVGVAQRFAYVIAPRESGCHPVWVDDSDDLTHGSRFGINFRTAQLRAGWLDWCGARVDDVANLVVDVRCALAGYAHRGWAPWAL